MIGYKMKNKWSEKENITYSLGISKIGKVARIGELSKWDEKLSSLYRVILRHVETPTLIMKKYTVKCLLQLVVNMSYVENQEEKKQRELQILRMFPLVEKGISIESSI